MKKNTALFVVIGIVAVILLGMYLQNKTDLFAVVNPATLSRTAPSTVSAGQQFTVTYTTSGVSGKWFVAWDDSVSGCTPSNYKNFLSSGDAGGSTNKNDVMTFTAPSSGSCTFTGYYQYTGGNKVNFPSLTVSVCTPTTCSALGKNCGSWSNGCTGTLSCGTCGSGQQCQSGVCKSCLTSADTDCSGTITFTELNSYASSWISGSVTFQDLITSANAWVSG